MVALHTGQIVRDVMMSISLAGKYLSLGYNYCRAQDTRWADRADRGLYHI